MFSIKVKYVLQKDSFRNTMFFSDYNLQVFNISLPYWLIIRLLQETIGQHSWTEFEQDFITEWMQDVHKVLLNFAGKHREARGCHQLGLLNIGLILVLSLFRGHHWLCCRSNWIWQKNKENFAYSCGFGNPCKAIFWSCTFTMNTNMWIKGAFLKV